MTQKTTQDDKVIIGRLGAAFGVRGWLKVNSFTEPFDNILSYQPWLIRRKGQWQTVGIEDIEIHGKSIVVKLQGCDDREKAKLFTNAEIAIEKTQLPALEKDEYYWTDLIGLRVTNKENIDLGIVESLMATGANDVLVVVKNKQQRLIPYIKQVILKINLEQRKLLVDWDKDF